MGKMNVYEASAIAKETYKRNKNEIVIINDVNEEITYNVIETIEDKSTGLHGYVLENEITNEIVISFEGNQTNYVVTQRGNDLFEG